MNYSKRTNQALWSAIMAVGIGGFARHALSQTTTNTYNFNANANSEVEVGGPYGTNANYVDLDGAGKTYPNYSVLQFSTGGGQFANSLATSVSPNFTVDLTDNDYTGETTEPTTLSFYLVDDTTTDISNDGSSPLAYESGTPLGEGLASPGATGGFPSGSTNIYYLGNWLYQGAGTGAVNAIPLSLNNATSDPAGSQSIANAESYLLHQVQNSANLRIIVTTSATDSTYIAYNGFASSTPEQIGLSVTSLTPTPNNSTIFYEPPLTGTSTDTGTLNLGRVIDGYASFTSTLSVGNGSATSGSSALILASPNNGLDGSSTSSTPVPAGGTGSVVVGFSSADTSGYTAGLSATGNVTFTDANNTSSTLKSEATVVVVDQRDVAAGGTGDAPSPAAINANKILVGSTGTVTLTLGTTNTNSNLPLGNDEGPDVLTTETLAAGAASSPYTVKDPFSSASVATISATSVGQFVFNSATADTNGVVGNVAVAVSGVYGDDHQAIIGTKTEYFEGNYTSFSSAFGLTNDGTTAGESDYADVYLQWQGYQAASVSSPLVTVTPGSSVTATLTNAATNDNTDTTNGLRAAAYVTGTTTVQTWSSGGWSIQSGFTTGTEIDGSQAAGDTNSYSATGSVAFNLSPAMINGTYGSAILVDLQNDQTIQGTHANDLAPVALNVQATVSSNPAVQNGAYTLNGGTLSAPATDLTGTFTQTGGTATFQSVSGTGKFALGGTGSITIGGGKALFSGINTTGGLTVTGGTAALVDNVGTATVGSLSIGSNGTLDIGNNRIIVDYSSPATDPIASIAAWIKNGFYDLAGPQIISSDITADDASSGLSYGIGYADGADGVVAGLPSGEIEIMFTLLGDANLDGTVNAEDFTPFSANVGKNGSWDQGDFNYDGTVNSEDFTPFSANLGKSATLAAAGALEPVDALSLANVPEPASIGLLAAGTFGLLARRRRQRQ